MIIFVCMNIGKSVRQFRKLSGLSIVKLAAKAGASPDYIFRIEAGKVTNIGIQKLQQIANALEVDLIELLKEQKAA